MTQATAPSAAIAFDDFLRVDIRVGTVVAAEPFPEARQPSLKLRVDFGPAIGVKKSAAKIVKHYYPAALVGRQVAAAFLRPPKRATRRRVVNFPPRQIGKFMSEVLVLGFPDADGEVVLISPGLAARLARQTFWRGRLRRPVPNGGRLF